MSVMVTKEVVRARTYFIFRVINIIVPIGFAVFMLVMSGQWNSLIGIPIYYLLLAYCRSFFYPDPTIDAWDKIPRDVRYEMVRTGYPHAAYYGRHDRDLRIRWLWATTLNKGIVSSEQEKGHQPES